MWLDKIYEVCEYFESSKISINSIDTPEGTGDHENYLQEAKEAYQIDDSENVEFKYTDCEKKAVMVRQKFGHLPWYSLSGYRLVFSKPAPDRYVFMPKNYTRTLRPDYG